MRYYRKLILNYLVSWKHLRYRLVVLCIIKEAAVGKKAAPKKWGKKR